MKIFEVKSMMEKMHPGKSVDVDLDDQCICAFDQVANNGVPNLFGHVCFNKAKVTIEGMEPIYMPIMDHRQAVGVAEMKRKIALFNDVNFPEDVLKNLDEMDKLSKMSEEDKLKLDEEKKREADAAPVNLEQFRADVKSASGLDDAAIDAKLEAYRNG